MSVKSPGLGALATLSGGGGYSTGTFTITLTGASSTTGTAKYTKIGNIVILTIPTLTGTSNATTKGYSGIPAAIRPTVGQRFFAHVVDSAIAANVGELQLSTDGTAALLILNAATGALSATFTGSGSFTAAINTIVYTLA